jgi:hypothetical protein
MFLRNVCISLKIHTALQPPFPPPPNKTNTTIFTLFLFLTNAIYEIAFFTYFLSSSLIYSPLSPQSPISLPSISSLFFHPPHQRRHRNPYLLAPNRPTPTPRCITTLVHGCIMTTVWPCAALKSFWQTWGTWPSATDCPSCGLNFTSRLQISYRLCHKNV